MYIRILYKSKKLKARENEMLGDRVRQVRRAQSLSQVEFGHKICISQAHLSKVERGKEGLSNSTLRLISILFDVNEEWLRTGK